MTVDRARSRGLPVDEEGFERLMGEQRERSRAGAKGEDARAAEFAADAGFTSDFVGFEKTDVLTQIGALEELEDGLFLAKLRESPFYAAGGGQVTDQGYLEHEGTGARADLVEATGSAKIRRSSSKGQGLSAGDRVRAVVPWLVRFPTMANHTATHLLHEAPAGPRRARAPGGLGRSARQAALRLHARAGAHVRAAGGGRADREREDLREPPVRTFITPIDEARNLGAMMLFGEKYGDEVRVVEIPDFSRELCGARMSARRPRSARS